MSDCTRCEKYVSDINALAERLTKPISTILGNGWTQAEVMDMEKGRRVLIRSMLLDIVNRCTATRRPLGHPIYQCSMVDGHAGDHEARKENELITAWPSLHRPDCDCCDCW